jgi:hypothetical protein
VATVRYGAELKMKKMEEEEKGGRVDSAEGKKLGFLLFSFDSFDF